MTPAISVMAIETVLMSTMSDPIMESDNQFSKEHTFDVWED